MKINELLLVAPNRIEKRSRTIDAIADDEVIIKVVSCGLCSSEFPVITGETEGQPGVSYRYKSYPCNLGHEVSGIIFEVGNNVRNFQLGDRVTGLAYYGSGFSDYVVAPEGMLIKIPKDIPLEFALGEPVMAAVNAAEMSDPFSNANSLFIGDGFMSLMTIAALSEYSQQKITVVGHHENRLSLAKDLGATHTLNAKNTDVYWEIRNLIDQDKKSVSKVFNELSKRYSSRKGGYSRVLKAGFRTGDDAPMAVIELVDRNPEAKKVDKPKKTTTKDKQKETQAEPKIASK